MYKKLSNAAWEDVINKYYSGNDELTIKDYSYTSGNINPETCTSTSLP